jgi:hypothetical protein
MSHHRLAISLPLSVLLAVSLAHAGSINYQVTDVLPGSGASLFPPGAVVERYTYYASDITFLANQELDIEFSAGLYGAIGGGQITPGFDLMLFQPNNPPGAPGIFSAFALQDVAAGAPWSVEFTFLGSNRPGSQSFSIEQFDENGQFITTLETGSTVPAGSPASNVPEPGTFGFISLVVVGRIVWWAVSRRDTGTPIAV